MVYQSRLINGGSPHCGGQPGPSRRPRNPRR